MGGRSRDYSSESGSHVEERAPSKWLGKAISSREKKSFGPLQKKIGKKQTHRRTFHQLANMTPQEMLLEVCGSSCHPIASIGKAHYCPTRNQHNYAQFFKQLALDVVCSKHLCPNASEKTVSENLKRERSFPRTTGTPPHSLVCS